MALIGIHRSHPNTISVSSRHHCNIPGHNPHTLVLHPLQFQSTCTHANTSAYSQQRAHLCTYLHTTTRSLSHTVIIPLLISIPLAVQSGPGGSSGEWRQAEPVRSGYYHRLAANLQGQTQLHFLSNASTGFD